jgi:hypothetical protein
MTKKRVSKSDLIRKWIKENPEASEQEGAAKIVAKKFKCSPSLLSSARKSMSNAVYADPVPNDDGMSTNQRTKIQNLTQLLKITEQLGVNEVRRVLDLL